MTIEEKVVGKTAEGEIIYSGPVPNDPNRECHYTKELRGGKFIRVLLSTEQYSELIQQLKETSGEAVVCTACLQEGHSTGNCHLRGGTGHGE